MRLISKLIILSLGLFSCTNGDNPKDNLTGSEIAIADEDAEEDELQEIIALLEKTGLSIDGEATLKAFEHRWTNGKFWISPANTAYKKQERLESDFTLVEMTGGDRHEGGYDFQGVVMNDSTILVSYSMIEDCKEGDLLVLRQLDKVDYIAVTDLKKNVKSVFVNADIPLANDIDVKVQDYLAGTFKDEISGDTIHFINSSKAVSWSGQVYKFKFEFDEYEALENVISFNNQHFLFERNGNVLKLTSVKPIEEESYREWLATEQPRSFELIAPSEELNFKDFLKKAKAVR